MEQPFSTPSRFSNNVCRSVKFWNGAILTFCYEILRAYHCKVQKCLPCYQQNACSRVAPLQSLYVHPPGQVEETFFLSVKTGNEMCIYIRWEKVIWLNPLSLTLVLASTSAPFSSRYRTILEWPNAAALMRAVQPCWNENVLWPYLEWMEQFNTFMGTGYSLNT